MKMVSFTIVTTAKIKYLGINLTKEVKDLYSENCKILKKKTEEESSGQRGGVGRNPLLPFIAKRRKAINLNQ